MTYKLQKYIDIYICTFVSTLCQIAQDDFMDYHIYVQQDTCSQHSVYQEVHACLRNTSQMLNFILHITGLQQAFMLCLHCHWFHFTKVYSLLCGNAKHFTTENQFLVSPEIKGYPHPVNYKCYEMLPNILEVTNQGNTAEYKKTHTGNYENYKELIVGPRWWFMIKGQSDKHNRRKQGEP